MSTFFKAASVLCFSVCFFQLPSFVIRNFTCIFLATFGLMGELVLLVNYKVKAVDANLSRESRISSVSSLKHSIQQLEDLATVLIQLLVVSKLICCLPLRKFETSDSILPCMCIYIQINKIRCCKEQNFFFKSEYTDLQ